MHSLPLLVSALIASACAETIVITVGGNTTKDAGAVFSPESVIARENDIVFFNFTEGNHTVTQSTFSSPCTPAHITDSSVNGFDSSFRNANNGTSVTNLPVTITDSNTTIWFYDVNTCALGGVGGININESSTETLDGFKRNAIRLNGTAPTTSSGAQTATSTGLTTNPTTTTTTTTTSSANRAVFVGGSVLLPLFSMLLGFSL
ncbi:hypothetical protein BYT27DRAFT_6630874 [Phlegmacium glaucopus]|nr:hypothetical protein BYT27DRAFT_6630874 [Phlegmacium glaucopus]